MKKYILAIIILLLLICGISVYKFDLCKVSDEEKVLVDSNDLIKERINEGKSNKEDNVNIVTETSTTTTVVTTKENVITENKVIAKSDDKKQEDVKPEKKTDTESKTDEKKEPELKIPEETKSIEKSLEELINKKFEVAVVNSEITKYEYPFQISNSLKSKIESVIGMKIDYSKNRFYIVNNKKLISSSEGIYIYDKYTKHVIMVDENLKRNTGTWFWCSKKNHGVLVDEVKQKSFFDKLEKYNITEIYMSYHHKQLDDDNIKRFIRNAYKRNIKVYLCLGELDFLMTDSYKSSIYEVFDCVYNYNNSVNYDERFTGVSYDAEVWNNSEYQWKGNIKIRDQHVSYIKEAKKYADSKNLSVIFTLPFWLVQYDTSNGNMYDEITKILDRTTLMVYRDTYDKIKHLVVDKQSNASDSLINIVSKNNCLIDIAVETMYSDEGNQVSFYEEEKENPGYLLKTLNEVDKLLINYNNRMFSIHHAMSLINDFNNGL